MYLEKLEAQGFKSFASKNVLTFPGMIGKTKRGITAIVGPNGSGKSNVADAVRWALGEQSMKSLRGKKSEDVIFSGSDKKGKLGMAEVSLYLNNEDGAAPIDYSQLVLTRRLYRNGDSEYLLNNSRVRLSDVQMLLAKAKFGQKTYSVIGQGTVEGFLNASLSERKEFFDEATGVKQFQIKRDEALNKLRSSYENLNQAEMLLIEIEPRLKSLTRQVNKLQKRGELEHSLKETQIIYYRELWHEINNKYNKYNQEYLELEKSKIEKDRKMVDLNNNLLKIEAQNTVNEEFNNLQRELNKLQIERDGVNKKIVRFEAEREVDLESRGDFDLSFLSNKKGEIKNDISRIREDLEKITEELKKEKEGLRRSEEEKNSLNNKSLDLNSKFSQITQTSDDVEFKKISTKIEKIFNKLLEAENEENLGELKKIIIEARNELRGLLDISLGDEKKNEIEKIQNELLGISSKKEKALTEINEKNLKIAVKNERESSLQKRFKELEQELFSVESKLKQSQNKLSAGEVAKQLEILNVSLEDINLKVSSVKEEISNVSAVEEKKRSKLFDLQRDIQSLQGLINTLNNNLNELKINSTRQETKLEDLESEIRNNLGSTKEIKEKANSEKQEVFSLRENIINIKKQLDHIGGIDPEIENEYSETKERFDFIDGQVSDLSQTIESLEKIIKELDLTIKDIFDKEFKIIQAKFEEYFKILFNGGRAKIVKVMEKEKEQEEKENTKDEKEEREILKSAIDIKRIKFLQKHNATGLAGIEIQATPPGKKISSISMLSGGERALTAIALISAIISVNPSPFVVLDEVDAALDEANSERLAKILDDLSHKTQFIVITHNRASMRRATILYGVTMGDDGVSKLLSIKLEEAKAVDKQ